MRQDFPCKMSPEFELGRNKLYRSLIQTMNSYVTEEGFVGPAKLSLPHRRRLTHQYITAMLACGFPRSAPVLQRAIRWLVESKTSDTERIVESYLVLDKIEAAIRMGERKSEFCELAIDLLLSHRKGPTRYEIQVEGREPFFALWCAKILLNYPERKDCLDAVTETLEVFASQHKSLAPGARDLSFLIALYVSRWPRAKIRQGPLKEMLDNLMDECEEGLFDVTPEMRPRLKDLSDNGLSPYITAGIELELHWSLVSTCYVIENMVTICHKSARLTSKVKDITEGLYRILAPATENLSEIFPEPYRQIMLAARSLTALAAFTGEDIARTMIPHLLEDLVENEMKKRLDERVEEKRRLQTVLKEWLVIDWDEEGQECLGVGYSGATVVRVQPSLKIPSSSAGGFWRASIPFPDTVILKYGRKTDLDIERRNYASIPTDFRHMVASVPAGAHHEIVDGEMVEYLVVEDLIGFKTLQEVLTSCPVEFRKPLASKLVEFLKHFYTMSTTTRNTAGIIRRLYTSPMLRYLETIHEFKQKVSRLSAQDLATLDTLQEIAKISALDSFEPTVMHGDLNIRNVLIYGKPSPGVELWFRLIDLDKFSRSGDFAYDVGEFLVDIECTAGNKAFIDAGVTVSNEVAHAFESYALSRKDGWYHIRHRLAKARFWFKVIEFRSRLGLKMASGNPLGQRQAEKLFEEELSRLLDKAYSLVTESIEMTKGNHRAKVV